MALRLTSVLARGTVGWRRTLSSAAAPPTSQTSPASDLALSEGERVLYSKLQSALAPVHLEVEDISGGCGSMYRVHVVSAKFAGLSRVMQHRAVNECLKEDIKQMHGMRLTTEVPPAPL